jgi:hypothetical protein
VLRDGLRHAVASLEALPAREPPEQLRASILAALPRPTARSTAQRERVHRPVSVWRYAAAFAGVLVTAAILYESGVGRGPDATELFGTIAGSRADSRADTVRLEFGSVTGQASLVRSDSALRLELQLQSAAPVDVVVARDGRIQRIAGAARTVLELPGNLSAGQSVELTFLVAGRQVGTATLAVP